MSATDPRTEHFGWARFYDEPEAYWVEQLAARQRLREATEERRAEQQARSALAILRERGLLRQDRLSYTRICELEHETGLFTGSWADYLNALHQAELRDRERYEETRGRPDGRSRPLVGRAVRYLGLRVPGLWRHL